MSSEWNSKSCPAYSLANVVTCGNWQAISRQVRKGCLEGYLTPLSSIVYGHWPSVCVWWVGPENFRRIIRGGHWTRSSADPYIDVDIDWCRYRHSFSCCIPVWMFLRSISFHRDLNFLPPLLTPRAVRSTTGGACQKRSGCLLLHCMYDKVPGQSFFLSFRGEVEVGGRGLETWAAGKRKVGSHFSSTEGSHGIYPINAAFWFGQDWVQDC